MVDAPTPAEATVDAPRAPAGGAEDATAAEAPPTAATEADNSAVAPASPSDAESMRGGGFDGQDRPDRRDSDDQPPPPPPPQQPTAAYNDEVTSAWSLDSDGRPVPLQHAWHPSAPPPPPGSTFSARGAPHSRRGAHAAPGGQFRPHRPGPGRPASPLQRGPYPPQYYGHGHSPEGYRGAGHPVQRPPPQDPHYPPGAAHRAPQFMEQRPPYPEPPSSRSSGYYFPESYPRADSYHPSHGTHPSAYPRPMSDTASSSNPLLPARTRRPNDKGCSCRKTKCLKLYCQCFAASLLCSPAACVCEGCKNTPAEFDKGDDGAIAPARRQVLVRNPTAFQDKFRARGGSGERSGHGEGHGEGREEAPSVHRPPPLRHTGSLESGRHTGYARVQGPLPGGYHGMPVRRRPVPEERPVPRPEHRFRSLDPSLGRDRPASVGPRTSPREEAQVLPAVSASATQESESKEASKIDGAGSAAESARAEDGEESQAGGTEEESKPEEADSKAEAPTEAIQEEVGGASSLSTAKTSDPRYSPSLGHGPSWEVDRRSRYMDCDPRDPYCAAASRGYHPEARGPYRPAFEPPHPHRGYAPRGPYPGAVHRPAPPPSHHLPTYHPAAMDRAARVHRVGCKCKKSRCLKKYCECFSNGTRCGDACKCEDCGNRPAPFDGAGSAAGAGVGVGPTAVDAELNLVSSEETHSLGPRPPSQPSPSSHTLASAASLEAAASCGGGMDVLASLATRTLDTMHAADASRGGKRPADGEMAESRAMPRKKRPAAEEGMHPAYERGYEPRYPYDQWRHHPHPDERGPAAHPLHPRWPAPPQYDPRGPPPTVRPQFSRFPPNAPAPKAVGTAAPRPTTNAKKGAPLPPGLTYRKVCSRCGRQRAEHGEFGFGNKCAFPTCGRCGAAAGAHASQGGAMGVACTLTVEEGAAPGASARYDAMLEDLAARAEVRAGMKEADRAAKADAAV
ncbi:hypothetical protein ACHAXT_010195 [Thalassiosira profunda]